MDVDLLDIIITSVQIVVLLVLVYGMIDHIKTKEVSITSVLYMFAMVSFLLNDLYWLSFFVLYPGERMPFSVNSIGEFAFILLFVSTYKQFFNAYKLKIDVQSIVIILMTCIYVCLWIRWSGTWTGNILGGIAFGYLACMVVGLIKEYSPAPKGRLMCIMIIAIIQLILNLLYEFVVTGNATDIVNIALYIITYTTEIILLINITKKLIQNEDNGANLILAGGFLVWCLNGMYMSGDYWYQLGDTMSIFAFVYIYICIKRKGDEKA